MDIPVVALEVLARLPLKSIARFRSVSKNWRSLFDADDQFRDHFISLHSSSSISWSIIQTSPRKPTLEIVGHHGCRTWGLTRSLGSSMSFPVETTIKNPSVLACTDGLVLLYAEATDGSPMYYVGNPLLREWFLITPHPSVSCPGILELLKLTDRFNDTGLVTKIENGFVVSYKVVWLNSYEDVDKLDFEIYSSDTGTWETRTVTCLNSHFLFSRHNSIALNGILHWFTNLEMSFIAYDFYGGHDDDKCFVVSLPDNEIDDDFTEFRRTLSISEGSIVYFNEFQEKEENFIFRVWRLVKYIDGPEAWQLFWETSLVSLSLIESDIHYFPVVMHPLNSEIIYLWSRNKKGLILYNLRTHVFSLQKETAEDSKCEDGCILSFNGCSEYMKKYFVSELEDDPNHLLFSQYVLPRWLHRLPRPQHT